MEAGRPTATIQSERFARVASKIVRGLTFLEFGTRLPANATFTFRIFELDDAPPLLTDALAHTMLDTNDAPYFVCRRALNPSADLSALWELVFFESLCITVGVGS